MFEAGYDGFWLQRRLEHAGIATTAIRQAEVLAAKRMVDRLRLRGPNGARDEFHLAATAQNLRKLAKLIPILSPIAA